jgi:lipoate synthase
MGDKCTRRCPFCDVGHGVFVSNLAPRRIDQLAEAAPVGTTLTLRPSRSNRT